MFTNKGYFFVACMCSCERLLLISPVWEWDGRLFQIKNALKFNFLVLSVSVTICVHFDTLSFSAYRIIYRTHMPCMCDLADTMRIISYSHQFSD